MSTPATYDLAALQALAATTVDDVTYFSGATPNGPHDYTGVSLWTLLTTADIANYNPLTSYLLARGSDGYEVLFSLGELDPAFGAITSLVAYDVDGAPMGNNGFARIVMPGDFRGGRYISSLASIQVVAVPEPPMLALLTMGFGGMTLLRRRKVKSDISLLH